MPIRRKAFPFFALEIALWRIGNSPPAPRFNVVAGPNDWSKTARAATRAVSGASGIYQVRETYWNAFGAYLKAQQSSRRMPRSLREPMLRFPIGRSGVWLGVSIDTEKKRISAELYIHDDKALFEFLHAQKAEIERELGHAPLWQSLPQIKTCSYPLVQ